jgi:putative spermidine/putrescine transport system ATP-binding protein
MTVGENVAYGLMVERVPKPERRKRAAEALAMVRLEGYDKRKPTELSGGQRQRVALARALVNRPKVLLLDEPLGALDLKLRREMQIELKQIQREVGITFVFVTHDQEEALTLSDRIAVFNDGRIEQVASPRELYQNPSSSFVASFVGTSNMLTGPAARAVFGRDGTFSIRPEKIHLGDVPDPGAATATGVVREVVYLGSANHYVVDIDLPWAGDSPQLVVMRQNFHDADDHFSKRGEKVHLAWLPEHVIELPGSKEPTSNEETA